MVRNTATAYPALGKLFTVQKEKDHPYLFVNVSGQGAFMDLPCVPDDSRRKIFL